MDKRLQSFQKVLEKLEEILNQEKNEIIRDSAIMRFQFCYDLAWKVIKTYLRTQGIECFSPRECFKNAFQVGLIENDELWLSMIEDRNSITHIYAEDMAEKVYSHLSDYLKLWKKLSGKLAEAKF